MLFLLASLLFSGDPGGPGGPGSSDRPDVYVIIADDLALSDLAVVETPHLDALAARGVSFTRAYANPMCTPSRHSFLFGVWSDARLGDPCEPKQPPFDRGAFTLPKMLDAAGYATALFGKWHLGGNDVAAWELTPHLFGFETWRAGVPSNVVLCGGEDYFEWTRVDDGRKTLSKQYQTEALLEAFLAWRTEPVEGPRFAVLSLQTPHAPMHVPPRFSDRPTEDLRAQYELMVRDMDATVGALLGPGRIDPEEDLVLFFGDNGTPSKASGPGQSGDRVKFSTFEGGIKVPLIVTGPGIAGGATTSALVHVVDVAATVAEVLGLAPPPGDGLSFRYALRDPSAGSERDHVYCSRAGLNRVKPRERAVVTEGFKLRESGELLELYDLARDPGETVDLSTDPGHAAVLAELQELLARHP
jgi:arylsulfatase A-like enzyme